MFATSLITISLRLLEKTDRYTLYIYDTRTGTQSGGPLRGHAVEVSSLAACDDGRWFASGSYDASLRICDTAARTVSGEPMQGHIAAIKAVAISPDSRLIASASNDKTIRFWNATDREVMRIFEGYGGRVISIAFSNNGE